METGIKDSFTWREHVASAGVGEERQEVVSVASHALSSAGPQLLHAHG